MGTLSHDPATDAGTPAEDVPTSLYRYYDQHGLLVYVGITSRGKRRNDEHNRTKQWWPFVASQQVEHFATRALALHAEKHLIVTFQPPFNTQHNRDAAGLRASYLAFAAAAGIPLTAAEVSRRNNRRLNLLLLDSTSGQLLYRTHPFDSAIARLLRHEPDVPVLSVSKATMGRVSDVTHEGGYALVVLTTTAPPDVRAPDVAFSRFRRCGNEKPERYALTQVNFRERFKAIS